MKISASFLSKPEKLEELDKSNISYIHCDIMDGQFVKNETAFLNLLKNAKLNHELDVHLMVEEVEEYVEKYSELNPKYITFHLEVENTLERISLIKNKNIQVGISINPETKVEELIPYLDKIDLVLIMSVHPGYGAQKFIPQSLEKIAFLKKYREENNLNYLIEIDGGINDEIIREIKGVDLVVVGSYITLSENFNEAIRKLVEI